MNGEVVRRPSGAAIRQHGRDLDAVMRQVDRAGVEVAGIGQVTRRALQEALYTNLTRKQAENLAPDGAEQYALIAWHGALAMVRRIDELDAGW